MAILVVRKSLSIAFQTITNQYGTLFYFFIFDKMAAGIQAVGDTKESYRFIRHDAGKHRLYHTTCVCEYHCLSAFLERDLCFRDTDQLAFTIRYLHDDWSDELPTR